MILLNLALIFLNIALIEKKLAMNPQVMTRINNVLVKIFLIMCPWIAHCSKIKCFFYNSDTFNESAFGDSEKLYPGSEITVIKC